MFFLNYLEVFFMIKDKIKDFLADTYQLTMGCKGNYSQLKNDTALVYDKDIPKALCNKLISNIDRYIDGEDKARLWTDDLASDNRIMAFENEFPHVTELLDIENEIKNIEKYLGLRINSWTLMANRILAIDGNTGSGGGAHRDSAFRHQVKVIWYLNKVSEDNGPFAYIPKTNFRNKKDILHWGYSDRIISPLDNLSVVSQKEAGTKLVCDTKCVHLGKPLKKGSRYAVTLYTFSSKNGVNELFRKAKL